MKKYTQNSLLLTHAVLFAIVCASLIPAFTRTALAATQGSGTATYTLLEPLPCIPSSTVNCGAAGKMINTVNINQYVSYAFNLMIALAAVAAVIMIVAGGFEYMTSIKMGGKAAGLERAQNAVWGLVLVLCTYIILKTVNPQLVNVPATLVPAISAPGVNPANMLDNALTEANNTVDYGAQAQSEINAATAAKQTVSQLQSTNTDLENQIQTLANAGADPETDPDIKALNAQIDNNNIQITTANINGIYNASSHALDSDLSQAQNSHDASGNVTPPSLTTIDSMQKSLDVQYASGMNQLNSAGGNSDAQQQQLTDKYNFNSAEATILKANDNAYFGTGPGYGAAGFTDAISQNLNSISDPTLKQQLQNDINTAITKNKLK